ncbi:MULTISPECIES: lysophospholipase [unclassified Streptomyces]|uniref:alpha/beta hydrolase n=1 Tax=unclassified Streptomyces TaxID=2593676 RepID=UPI0023656BB7|nr:MULTISPECIES: lysophospholipase [unclassified Streptomyces]MDF3149015.1 lysophospholipase [Streptomyces sp. T21Q-yed]WDF43817.1 lysophospholipase [Streptomyces sp. T12]
MSSSFSWDEPEGLAARGTLIVLAGRGEHGAVYERFGRRLAFDAYRVRALGDPTTDPSVLEQAAKLLADESLPGPKVLVGSDTGARYAAHLAAEQEAGVDALILAGLPTARWAAGSWEAEVEARTACPTHQGRLTGDAGFRRGALDENPDLPELRLDRVRVPVLALHGKDDTVSPVERALDAYAGHAGVRTVTFDGGRHDVLNDALHRTVAATVVLFLERLRLSPELPEIAEGLAWV